MPNLIDKLVPRVDAIRQKAADRFGLPAHNVYRVLRSWDGGEVGAGNFTDLVTLITPTPKVKFSGGDVLRTEGRDDERSLVLTEISLTFTEGFLTADPRSAGQELFYKLVERNSQGAATTYWQLTAVPEVLRAEICWKLQLRNYVVCS